MYKPLILPCQAQKSTKRLYGVHSNPGSIVTHLGYDVTYASSCTFSDWWSTRFAMWTDLVPSVPTSKWASHVLLYTKMFLKNTSADYCRNGCRTAFIAHWSSLKYGWYIGQYWMVWPKICIPMLRWEYRFWEFPSHASIFDDNFPTNQL
jgi:hypothetical protein